MDKEFYKKIFKFELIKNINDHFDINLLEKHVNKYLNFVFNNEYNIFSFVDFINFLYDNNLNEEWYKFLIIDLIILDQKNKSNFLKQLNKVEKKIKYNISKLDLNYFLKFINLCLKNKNDEMKSHIYDLLILNKFIPIVACENNDIIIAFFMGNKYKKLFLNYKVLTNSLVFFYTINNMNQIRYLSTSNFEQYYMIKNNLITFDDFEFYSKPKIFNIFFLRCMRFYNDNYEIDIGFEKVFNKYLNHFGLEYNENIVVKTKNILNNINEYWIDYYPFNNNKCKFDININNEFFSFFKVFVNNKIIYTSVVFCTCMYLLKDSLNDGILHKKEICVKEYDKEKIIIYSKENYNIDNENVVLELLSCENKNSTLILMTIAK